MSHRTPYTYVVLRYRHDAVAGECVNVGVVMHSAHKGFLEAKLSAKYGRLREVFPDLDSAAFRESIRAVERGVRKLSKRESGDFLARLASADSAAYNVLRPDDSSFIWGEIGAGVTADLDAELEKLFQRFVTWYDHDKVVKKSDDAVWRPVRDRLAEKTLADRLVSNIISSDLTSVEFDHTWRNGALHCYQPLSFDLSSTEHIREKAARWSGYLVQLKNAETPFKPHFIVGRPTDRSLDSAYRTAVKALKQSEPSPDVYEETDVEALVDSIEKEMRAHDSLKGNAH